MSTVLDDQGPRLYNFLCSTQLSIKCIMLINFKMPTIIGILTCISMINTTFERFKAKNFFICRFFSFYEQLKFCAQLSWAWKKFITRALFWSDSSSRLRHERTCCWGFWPGKAQCGLLRSRGRSYSGRSRGVQGVHGYPPPRPVFKYPMKMK